MADNEAQSKRFAPKVPVQLDPPKDDPISPEELAKCDGRHSPLQTLCFSAHTPTHTSRAGSDPNRPTLVAIKGVVFDVTRNAAYGSSGQYRGESLSRHVDLGCGVILRRGNRADDE